MSSNRDAVSVRVAAIADCETLANKRRQLQDVLERENPWFWRMTEARRVALPKFYAESIVDREVRVLVAEVVSGEATVIVGTAIGRIEGGRDVLKFGSIEDVWVDPAHRGRGICGALIRDLVGFFRARGVVELRLGFVSGGSAAAVWQHLGFQPAVVIATASVDAVERGMS